AHRRAPWRPRRAAVHEGWVAARCRRARSLLAGARRMKRLVTVALGILTAIGGFVDIGELVTGTAVGARFEMRLAWATGLSVVTIIVFAEMSGRVAAVSQRPVFDLVRERLGPRFAFANLVASFGITLATVAAEIGGVALAIELATSVNYVLWVPLVALL